MSRRAANEIVVILWRDIPAQVTGRSGDDKHQYILPRRFQKAIDRAAMVADKKSAHEYVGEWRRQSLPLDPGAPLAATVEALAAQFEAEFPLERLDEYVRAGGFDPTSTTKHSPDPSDVQGSTV